MNLNPQFYGDIKSGKFKLHNKDAFELWVSTLPDGIYKIQLNKPRKNRSNNQNAYYWGVLIPILGREIGYTPDEMHDAIKLKFLIDRTRVIPTIKSTTGLSTVDFESLMTSIREWASQELHIYLPLPNEYT